MSKKLKVEVEVVVRMEPPFDRANPVDRVLDDIARRERMKGSNV